jgi:hypothetical protein
MLNFSHFCKIGTVAKCITRNVLRKMFLSQGLFSSSARERRREKKRKEKKTETPNFLLEDLPSHGSSLDRLATFLAGMETSLAKWTASLSESTASLAKSAASLARVGTSLQGFLQLTLRTTLSTPPSAPPTSSTSLPRWRQRCLCLLVEQQPSWPPPRG